MSKIRTDFRVRARGFVSKIRVRSIARVRGDSNYTSGSYSWIRSDFGHWTRAILFLRVTGSLSNNFHNFFWVWIFFNWILFKNRWIISTCLVKLAFCSNDLKHLNSSSFWRIFFTGFGESNSWSNCLDCPSVIDLFILCTDKMWLKRTLSQENVSSQKSHLKVESFSVFIL